MHELTPKQAAVIANGVYALRLNTVSQTVAKDMSLGCEGLFKVDESSRFTGKSGAALMKSTTGFGYIAAGIGEFAGEALCATRGTEMTSAADWASNLNVGLKSAPGGHLAHSGFIEVWKSFGQAIEEFLRTTKPLPKHVHCVGHSLGGALALLNADYFTARGISATVYTFGAPRVGYAPFCYELTGRTNGRIYRVSHVADPVPMIPVFPFIHPPFSKNGIAIGAEYRGFPVSPAAHSMTEFYIRLVQNAATWNDLALGTKPSNADPRKWLELPEGSWGITMYSAEALAMIGRALAWLLKQAGTLVAIGGNVGLTAALSLPDLVAYLLSKGAQLSKELAGYGISLIRAILLFLGRVSTSSVNLTMAFLRWVFDLLYSTVASMARLALSQAR